MLLHHRIQGNGLPLIILHGLFGSMDNWRSLASQFARQFQVITVDLPNHGRSPHKKVFNYPSLARDLASFMDQLGMGAATLLGHSLGGKIAMQYALDFPERVTQLVVVDIAPRAYPPEHRFIFEALGDLNPSAYDSRREIDKALSNALPDHRIRQFLLTNLDKGKNGYRWRINLDDLHRNYRSICAAIEGGGTYRGPTLFVKGERSDYIQKGEEIEIRKKFPKANIMAIPRAGHWVHADTPEVFVNAVLEFLS
ncbi:alpha/beta hydrolase fold protein [Nitrosococcus halophilus Nc 4]|uniref:Alpha/beta hydrolase fold protein n=1 Tax=Nitrosococcus halophilus (strain Nc4) TaxID=472759 RepID=D5BZU1_NITHN|nr:alpha/beta fold hydrolase [Nitrosococcus halophilus]ADE14386.1 alpha/beta hydrolase fold protein [Nitrosococcus halophilus Nc 4]